jgi:nanoRNase/pAp phosphatase (c-di-AMP/oligoRNAs hydrolase)
VTYYDTEDNRKYSLRSVEGGVDVSEVAALFGGGGHKHAAGFKIPLDRINEVSMVPTAQ